MLYTFFLVFVDGLCPYGSMCIAYYIIYNVQIFRARIIPATRRFTQTNITVWNTPAWYSQDCLLGCVSFKYHLGGSLCTLCCSNINLYNNNMK